MTTFTFLSFLLRPRVIFVATSLPILFFLFYFFKPEAMDEAVSHLSKLKEKVVNLTKSEERLLENLFKAKYKPHYNGKTIFFLETHINKNKNLSLTARQACSIEAAGDALFCF
jgi:hypothetical protein